MDKCLSGPRTQTVRLPATPREKDPLLNDVLQRQREMDLQRNDVLAAILHELRTLNLKMSGGAAAYQGAEDGANSIGEAAPPEIGLRPKQCSPEQELRGECAISATAVGPIQQCFADQVWPREVEISMVVRRIFDIKTVDQTCGVSLFLLLKWAMPPGEEPPGMEENDGDWEPHWTPKFRLKSLQEEKIRQAQYVVTFDEVGNAFVVAEIDILAKISVPLELHVFPNDCQQLVIELQSTLSSAHVKFVPAGRDFVKLKRERCLLNDFSFMHELPLTYDLSVVENASKNQVYKLGVAINVVRKSTHYLVNVGLGMFLIVSCVFCSWALHPADIPNRLVLDFGLILTAVAFKLILTEMLPPISYLTTLDVYILISFFFLAGATCGHAVLCMNFIKISSMSPLILPPTVFDEDQLLKADQICFLSYAALWCVFNIGFTCHFIHSRHKTYTAFLARARRDQGTVLRQTTDFSSDRSEDGDPWQSYLG
mmetsp:Transcript_62762/g.138078  ORF Transcript_62762/g.138078 Transcript_62762/m.138078 type:complete len:483 (+) Transcript_62762:45-1493(+)